MEVKKTPSGLKFMEADGGAKPPHQRVFWWLLRGGAPRTTAGGAAPHFGRRFCPAGCHFHSPRKIGGIRRNFGNPDPCGARFQGPMLTRMNLNSDQMEITQVPEMGHVSVVYGSSTYIPI